MCVLDTVSVASNVYVMRVLDVRDMSDVCVCVTRIMLARRCVLNVGHELSGVMCRVLCRWVHCCACVVNRALMNVCHTESPIAEPLRTTSAGQ